MKIKLSFLLFFIVSPLIFYGQSKTDSYDMFSDIFAKSIYIYRSSITMKDSLKITQSKSEIVDNIKTLDTLISVQINEYLKLNNSVIKSLEYDDKSLLDSIGELHNTLMKELMNLTYRGKVKDNAISYKSINSSYFQSEVEEKKIIGVNIHNDTQDTIQIFTKIIVDDNNEFFEKRHTLTPNELLNIETNPPRISSKKILSFIAIKYYNKYSGRFMVNSRIIEFNNIKKTLEISFSISDSKGKENTTDDVKKFDNFFY